MPRPADSPDAQQPWWRRPLRPEPGDGTEPVAAGQPVPPEATTGPTDATVVLPPVPDTTMELPPIPAGPVPAHRPVAAPGVPAQPAPPAPQPHVPQPQAPQQHVPQPHAPLPPPSAAAGAPVGQPQQAPAEDAVLRPPLGIGQSRRSMMVATGGVALALVLVLVAAYTMLSGTGGGSAKPEGAAVSAIDPGTIRATASSVQRRAGNITYGARNTLDGDVATAWNSDGDGGGRGIKLTYTFPDPVLLRTITIRNGYQKVRSNDGVDLWPLNERVRQFTVTTDAGSWTWDLADKRNPQTLRQDFGRTSTVTLTITSVYPSSKYRDVAISELEFGAAG